MKKNFIKFLTVFFTCVLLALSVVACGDNNKESNNTTPENICIIDASASMLASYNDSTRFERAVEEVRNLAEDIFKKGGVVTVILASAEPTFIAQRMTANDQTVFFNTLDELVEIETACSYGSANIESAMALADTVLEENSNAEVLLYTGTSYETIAEGITIVDVSSAAEWNAAILDAKTTLKDDFYMFEVDVASYGKNTELEVVLDIYDANGGVNMVFTTRVLCSDEQIVHVVFINSDLYHYYEESFEQENTVYYLIDSYDSIYSYKAAYVSLTENAFSDSLPQDNFYHLYEQVFEVGDTIQLNIRGENPKFLSGMGEIITEIPATFTFEFPGIYTLTQTLPSGEEVVEYFFVRIPKSESNIFKIIDVLPSSH